MSQDSRKDLPPVTASNFQEKVREALSTYLGSRGDKLDRGVTLRDLSDAGIVTVGQGYLRSGRGTPILGPGSGAPTWTGGGGGGGGGGGDPYVSDLTPPPTPTGFTATAAISNVLVECAPQIYAAGHGHGRSKLYGATWTGGALPVFADAEVITEFQGNVASYATNPATTWHLWLTWVTVDGVESTAPAGGTNGVVVTTGQDVSTLLAALTGKISETELFTSLGTRIDLIDAADTVPGSVAQRVLVESNTRAGETGDLFAKYSVKIDVNGYVSGFGLASTANNATPTSAFVVRADSFSVSSPSGPGITPVTPFIVNTTPTIENGVAIPAGVYMDGAYVRNLTAAVARLGNAWIDDAKIANLSAAKLTAGNGTIGGILKSSNYSAGTAGWLLQPNGVAEFQNAIVRGTVYATAGELRGLSIKDAYGNVILSSGSSLQEQMEPFLTTNLTDLSWWKRDAAIPWTSNGEFNRIISSADVSGIKGPKGYDDLMWFCNEINNDGQAGGGWQDAPVTIDPSKTYRFVVPIYRQAGNGSAYWGILANTVCDLNTTTPNSNPYFASSGALTLGRWYLFVGFVYPAGSTNNTHDGAGIYDCTTGALVVAGNNYTARAGYTATSHRAYQYYADNNASQLFGRPLVNVVDGSEPSLREYFSETAMLNSYISLDGLGMRSFRVGALGLNATGAPIGASLFDGQTNATLVGSAYMYRVAKINRATGVVTDVGGYNTWAGAPNPANMAAALNAIGNDHIVVVFTCDEPQGNRLTAGLDAAMYRCGASRAIFGSPNFKYRSAYALIGIPGCGEGNGAEFYQGATDSDTNAWVDAAFSVVGGNIVGVAGSYTPKTLQDYGYIGALNATANITTKGSLSLRPAGADGDFYYATDIARLYQKISGTWTESANNFNNTSQLIDGAGLGYTAVWAGIPSGSGKPADYATANQSDAVTNAAISARLAKSGSDILTGPISLNAATAILVGNTTNGLYLGNTGIVGRKAGATTFSVDASGTATFSGSITGSSFNVGDYTGYAWPAAGGTGVHISTLGILAGNYNASAGNPSGKYFQLYTPVGGQPHISTNIPAYIEDLQVSTAKIGLNAVTTAAYASGNGFSRYWSGGYSGGFTDVFSTLTFSADAGDVVLFEATWKTVPSTPGGPAYSSDPSQITTHLTFNGTNVASHYISTLGNLVTNNDQNEFKTMRWVSTAAYTGTQTLTLNGYIGIVSPPGYGSYGLREITLSAFIRRR